MIAYVTRLNPYVFPRPIYLKRAIGNMEIYMLGKIKPTTVPQKAVSDSRSRKLLEIIKRIDITKYIDNCIRQGGTYNGFSLVLEHYYATFFRKLPARNVIIKNTVGALGALRASKNVVIDLMDYWHCNRPYVIFNSIDYYILRKARCIITWSKAIAGLLRYYLGHKCILYLPFGVDLEIADPVKVEKLFFEEYPNLANYAIIGYSGGGEAYHGIDKLLYAFSLLERRRRDIFLVIQTWGHQMRILSIAKRLGLKRILVMSPSPIFNDPIRLSFLRASTVLVNTASKVPGIYLAERTTTYWYMSAGRPIVAEETLGVKGVLKHGINALLVPLDDVKRLAKAIETIVDDTSLARKLGDNARKIAEERYNWSGELGTRARIILKSLFE